MATTHKILTDRQTDRQGSSVFFCCGKVHSVIQKGTLCHGNPMNKMRPFFVARTPLSDEWGWQ